MEGSGVIDLNKLDKQRSAFAYYSHHLAYPEPGIFDEEFFRASFTPEDPGYRGAETYWKNMKKWSHAEVQEYYTATFDFEKSLTLYMTFAKFEDSKERGQMLARLKVMYEMYGLNMPKGELSDFLPLMCEFVHIGDWLEDERSRQSFALLFAVLEDGTFHLREALEKHDHPYLPLVKSLRRTLRSCVKEEEVSVQ
ncbi:respiratory nitrate reductase chaperone NarJ [Salimicrobium album]|uniref:Respiratory nitrate reductase chaperone NarJ n=2 Tax=Salimicrobium TaxID=351195 RepID=A0ABY1KX62_9BACI|nr:respiratory nitrate reductase chaperone NarJ [Salimicrobium album]SIS88555.1 respiratory nitrate reductase chaperone NarJ [Salimicrobium salexigens]